MKLGGGGGVGGEGGEREPVNITTTTCINDTGNAWMNYKTLILQIKVLTNTSSHPTPQNRNLYSNANSTPVMMKKIQGKFAYVHNN